MKERDRERTREGAEGLGMLCFGGKASREREDLDSRPQEII